LRQNRLAEVLGGNSGAVRHNKHNTVDVGHGFLRGKGGASTTIVLYKYAVFSRLQYRFPYL
jgi:hypothetical protein